jgi:transposase
METNIYDHYIAVDWSIKNMAIARMTKKLNAIKVVDVPSDIVELKVYLGALKGTIALTVEETTTAQWLYTELKDCVDRILICDPYRNRLLSDGPKTDKIDAAKLVQLLKAGLLKEVYHSADQFLVLRRLVSGYDDLVRSGVRLKNQRYSLLRACGKSGKEKKDATVVDPSAEYVLTTLDRQIQSYEEEKKGYEKQFQKCARACPEIRHQASLPGIGLINAMKIVSQVVCPNRFPDKGHYISYAGLMKLEKMSGGKSYGRRSPRYSRILKSVYKTGAFAAIEGDNPIHHYYNDLINEKGYPEYQARHAVSRRLAVLSWGVFKSGKAYQVPRRKDVRDRQEVVSSL